MSPFDEMFKWLPHMRFQPSPPANLRVSQLDGRTTRLVDVHGVSFLVWDNGGEVGVERLNSGLVPRFFPMTAWGIDLDAGTLADRLVRVILDEPIDYGFRMDFALQDVGL